MHQYTAYGLTIDSPWPLPMLLPRPPGSAPDVLLNWVGDAESASSGLDWVEVLSPELGWRPTLTFWRATGNDGDYLRLSLQTESGPVAFVFHPGLDAIDIQWASAVELADVTAYLIGIGLGCLLRRRGVICLHASALAVDGGAILLVGESGSGKSTTATALMYHGGSLLSDDIAPLYWDGERWLVQSGYPRLRLLPDAALSLAGSIENLTPVFADPYDKRYLEPTLKDSAEHAFCPHPLPLAAVYILGERSLEVATPAIVTLPPQQRLLALLRHTYGDYVVEPSLRDRVFTWLGHLARMTPIRQLERPDDLARLPALCKLILEDARRSTTDGEKRDG